MINDNYFLAIFTNFENKHHVCDLLMFICWEPPQRPCSFRINILKNQFQICKYFMKGNFDILILYYIAWN